MTRVAVAGGAGFIGRHVARRLAEAGMQVWTLDRQPVTDAFPGEESDTVDLADPGTVEAVARRGGGVDAVVWLAASIRHRTGVDETTAEDLRIMVASPLALLRALAPAPASFVYASSIQVYGHPRYLPVDEEHPTDPVTAYGVAKLCAEDYLRIACGTRGVALAALRLAFVYGEGQHPENVIPRFLAAARRGEPPVVHGPGDDVRDDVYAGDVARAIELAVRRRADGVCNLASGHPHTLREVAEVVCRIAGGQLRPRHVAAASRWVDRSFAADRARTLLGFAAETRLEEGLGAMWREAERR